MREGIEAHKAQLPLASEAAKALAAEQRARLSELKVLLDAAAEDADVPDGKQTKMVRHHPPAACELVEDCNLFPSKKLSFLRASSQNAQIRQVFSRGS